MGSRGSLTAHGEQSPPEAAGTLCLSRGTEPGWPHSAASAITLTSPPSSDTDSPPQGEGFASPPLSTPGRWALDAPSPPALPAGSSLRTRSAHTVSPRGCDSGRQRSQSGREPPPRGPALAPDREHQGLGRGRPRCQRGPRRMPGTGSVTPPHRTPHCPPIAVPCPPHNHCQGTARALPVPCPELPIHTALPVHSLPVLPSALPGHCPLSAWLHMARDAACTSLLLMSCQGTAPCTLPAPCPPCPGIAAHPARPLPARCPRTSR